MAERKVAIRFGTDGRAQVVADLDAIAQSGDVAAKKWARSFERAGQDAEAAMERQRKSAEKLAVLMPGVTPGKADAFAGARYDVGKDAAASAAVYEAAFRKQEQAARALLASIDPVIAAQQRFDREIAQAKTLMDVGALSTEEYARVEARLAAQLADSTGAVRKKGAAFASAAPQIQDLFVQISMGANPVNALIVQGGQLAGQLQYAGGAAGTFAAFMMGPWGVALQVAVLALGPLVSKLLEGSEASGQMTEAARAHAKALETLQAAVDRLNGSQAALNRTTRQGITDELNAAEAARRHAVQVRGLIDAQLEESKGRLRSALVTQGAGGGSVAGSMFSIGVGQEADARQQIAAIEGAQRINDAKRKAAESATQVARSQLIARDVAGQLDKATAETNRHADAVDKLTRANQAKKLSDPDFEAALLKEGRAHEANTKAIEAADKSGAAAKREHNKELKEQAKLAREAATAQREYLDALQAVLREANPQAAASADMARKMALLGRGMLDGSATGVDAFVLDGGFAAMQRQSQANTARLMGASSDEIDAVVGKGRFDRALLQDKANEGNRLLSPEDQQRAEERVRSVADLYRNLMSGGVGSIWDRFKQRGMDVIADLLAEWTMKQSGGRGLLGAIGTFLGGGVGRNATGTEYWSGGMSLVGEGGPEIVSMPRGSRVTPAGETRRLLSGSGGTPSISMPVTIHAPGADAAALARVEQALRDLSDTLPARAVAAWQDARDRRLVRV